MRYCESCGTPHECAAEIAADKSDVRIAQIQADRDVEIAKLQSKATVAVAETDAAHSTGHAEGVIEGVEAILDSGTPAPPPETGAPIVVETPAPEPEEPEEPEMAPPVIDSRPGPSSKPSGWWSGYR